MQYTDEVVLKFIIEGNQLMRRHYKQRVTLLNSLYDKMQEIKDKQDKDSELIDQALLEIFAIQDNLVNLATTTQNINPEEYFKYRRVSILNEIIQEIDDKEKIISHLQSELEELQKAISVRDTAIDVLEEHLDLETSSNFSMVDEIAEMEDIKDEFEERLLVFNTLSKYDPRYQALKILETHSQGISYIQLKYMLGTTPFQASKVIDELMRMDLIHRSLERDLLHVNTDLLSVMH